MDVELVFSSRPRVKILKILAEIGQLNTSEIAHRLGINYETAFKHLKVLEDEKILLHKECGRIHSYRLDENSPRAKAVQKLLEAWENTSTNLP